MSGSFYQHPNSNGQPQIQQQPQQQQHQQQQTFQQPQQQQPIYGQQQQQLPLQQQQPTYAQNYAPQPQPPPCANVPTGLGVWATEQPPYLHPPSPPAGNHRGASHQEKSSRGRGRVWRRRGGPG